MNLAPFWSILRMLATQDRQNNHQIKGYHKKK